MGVDQTPWGGELLRVDQTDAFRLGHFRTLFLPGGDRVPREPWRMGVSALCALGRGEDAEKIFSHPQAHDLANHLKSAGQTFFPKTSSAGRLFDAAYALLGGKEQLDHEGQGAMELEVWARSFRGQNQETGNGYVISEADGQGILDFLPLLEKLRMERKKEKGAALFHETLSLGVRDFAVWGRERTGIRSIVLSGGVFQNSLLSRRVSALLGQSGFSVYRPLRVPTNDGGLSLGQAWVALSRILTDIRIKKIERRIECVLPFRHA
jgi:hydrogenase maturation protein HypF